MVRVPDVVRNRFAEGLEPWLARLGNLRNVVRQEMVARQLAAHLPAPPVRVLDVGAGQGTQALRLAALGHDVTAIEPEARMRDAFRRQATALQPAARSPVTLLAGDVTALEDVTSPAAFDVVLCHGLLMYLPESDPAITTLASRLAPGGLLSLVTRNGAAMAWRPAIRRDWTAALAMLDEISLAEREGRDARYRNEIGVDARADTLESLDAYCRATGLTVEQWYGIRVATDDVPVNAPTPPPDELARLFDVEERLGRTDPYRALGTLLHVVARAPGTQR